MSTMGSSSVRPRWESCTAFWTALAAASTAASSEWASASSTLTRTSTTGMPLGPAVSRPRRMPSLSALHCWAAMASMSTPEPRRAGSSSTFAHASTLPSCVWAMPLRILVLPWSWCCPVARDVSRRVAKYSTYGLPSGKRRTLNTSAKRSRKSSWCSDPMHERMVSPVREQTFTSTPASSSEMVSSARSSRSCSWRSRLSICRTKVQHPCVLAWRWPSAGCPSGGHVTLALARRNSQRPFGTHLFGTGTKTRSPGPAAKTLSSSPPGPCTNSSAGRKSSPAAPAFMAPSPASFRAFPARSRPRRTRTCTRQWSASCRRPKAQPTKESSCCTDSSKGLTPSSLTISLPLSAGMKVWMTSCSASTPKPLLALPATRGTTRPAAAARRRAAATAGRGTWPSFSR
mmetsp:Transcript_79494/g.246587  ORF Transcript_79494/g.246587 Transcript_79494/m.246587 type:complete len:401 (+) Transcript_79494:312-1514(+)